MLSDKMISKIGDMLEKKTGPRRVEVTTTNIANTFSNQKFGWFHGFSTSGANGGRHPVAIVEYEDGQLDYVELEQMRFTDRDTAE